MATLRDVRCKLVASLQAAGIVLHEAQREADLIIEFATGWKKVTQMAEPDKCLTPQALATVSEIESQRRLRKPLQYLLGEQYFMGLRFKVQEGVLIPRADSETLVELAAKFLRTLPAAIFCDVGTGSGCLAISILCALPSAHAYAVDISPAALCLAAENAAALGVSSRLTLIECAWADFQTPQLLDALICNPPYIPLSEAPALPPEVGVFEPREALFGSDEDGLGFFRSLSITAHRHLKEGGLIALEVGFGQAQAVSDMLSAAGWRDVTVTADLNGIARCISAFHAVGTI